MGKVWIGADPGGQEGFGVAILRDSECLICKTVSSVHEAVKCIDSHCRERIEPNGVGIDAPLWWSSDKSGWRLVDKKLRKIQKIECKSVMAVNSLHGSVIAGGMLFAQLVQEEYPNIKITESHPKALLQALDLNDETGDSFAKKFSVPRTPNTWKNEHERDAVIAAVCAREGFSSGEWEDLSRERGGLEQNPKSHWLKPVYYWWPSQSKDKTL
ncbi:MAG: DUF429 domain-containing protein [Rhodobacteraceae bacterium]|nr:DUF429 domain-containing protein [Paracoccaceae bacterium]